MKYIYKKREWWEKEKGKEWLGRERKIEWWRRERKWLRISRAKKELESEKETEERKKKDIDVFFFIIIDQVSIRILFVGVQCLYTYVHTKCYERCFDGLFILMLSLKLWLDFPIGWVAKENY